MRSKKPFGWSNVDCICEPFEAVRKIAPSKIDLVATAAALPSIKGSVILSNINLQHSSSPTSNFEVKVTYPLKVVTFSGRKSKFSMGETAVNEPLFKLATTRILAA